MVNWVLKGLHSGIKTSTYPRNQDEAAGISPGRPVGTNLESMAEAEALVARCPTGAIARDAKNIAIDYRHCIHCSQCSRNSDRAASGWETSYEWAALADGAEAVRRELGGVFARSLYIRFVDAGACGACMSEARQLDNPYYNMHRLGFFITPTPRNADVLLVAGPVSDAMRIPLRKTYEAMPTPKRVVAMGVCAISGGVFGPSFASSGGVAEIIPVDVVVPGCPPPPMAILHALLLVAGRKPPMALTSLAPGQAAGGA